MTRPQRRRLGVSSLRVLRGARCAGRLSVGCASAALSKPACCRIDCRRLHSPSMRT